MRKKQEETQQTLLPPKDAVPFAGKIKEDFIPRFQYM